MPKLASWAHQYGCRGDMTTEKMEQTYVVALLSQGCADASPNARGMDGAVEEVYGIAIDASGDGAS
jgi:hypothetical protein